MVKKLKIIYIFTITLLIFLNIFACFASGKKENFEYIYPVEYLEPLDIEVNQLEAVDPCASYNGYESWYCNAGISESDFQYIDYIIFNESSYDMYAVNDESGAVGLCQLNPNFHEIPTTYFLSADNQIAWCNDYAIDRYGNWESAYYFHAENGWW